MGTRSCSIAAGALPRFAHPAPAKAHLRAESQSPQPGNCFHLLFLFKESQNN
ncbi:hypothetical protein predicted by Glimmer/Critica [Bdellovibrio bacteriovorus HD100]|uniref:Uncharacterized protein n=1 Tax=Bdellovibrio bacteriovorus (strain ATCC 15356 / DSM 50701 / NCIMB 9529 / HD100) TaxID=264462 RepID=Q6MKI9_BDEBA|nr:hypothetical protein predicted by Glimmer/Critica [Bdellovibrio bacteriovorus HD100]